jgi:hypothetical protein
LFFRTCTLRTATVGAFCTNLELPRNNIGEKQYSTSHPIFVIDNPEKTSAVHPFLSSTILFHVRNLSSNTDSKSTNNESEELEGFSDLDTDAEEEDVEEEMLSDSDEVSADEEENDTDEEDVIKKRSLYKKSHEFPLFELILNSPRHTLEESLEKWVKEGNEIKKQDVVAVLWQFRLRNLSGNVFQVPFFSEVFRRFLWKHHYILI